MMDKRFSSGSARLLAAAVMVFFAVMFKDTEVERQTLAKT